MSYSLRFSCLTIDTVECRLATHILSYQIYFAFQFLVFLCTLVCQGVPTLDESSSTCHTHINWVTQYACSRLTNSSTSSSSASGRWVLSDPVTSAAINLTSLPASLSRVYAAPDGSSYKLVCVCARMYMHTYVCM